MSISVCVLPCAVTSNIYCSFVLAIHRKVLSVSVSELSLVFTDCCLFCNSLVVAVFMLQSLSNFMYLQQRVHGICNLVQKQIKLSKYLNVYVRARACRMFVYACNLTVP